MDFLTNKTITATNANTHELYCMDNLTFLDSFNQKYEGTVDFCYIDPPYNTGNTDKNGFTYNDFFYKEGDKDKHVGWFRFLTPRLEPAKKLLKETGVIAVSIDDSEVHRLRIEMDRIFGENNFIAQIVIDGGAMKNNARLVSVTHEYLLVYAKNLNKINSSKIKWRTKRDGIEKLREQEAILRKKHKKDYTKITEELKKWMKTSGLSKRLKVFYNADAKGLYTHADLSAPNSNKRFDYPHPITGKPVQVPSRGWGYTYEKLADLEAEGLIEFFDSHTQQPLKKHYLTDDKDQVVKSVISEFPARTSTHLLEKMLGKRSSFNNPKNLDFITFLVDMMCPTDGVVMDYFAGSGTTGHAVIDLNMSENATRKFIMCTNNENNIYVDVTKPRILAALTGIWGNGSKHKPSEDGLNETLDPAETK